MKNLGRYQGGGRGTWLDIKLNWISRLGVVLDHWAHQNSLWKWVCWSRPGSRARPSRKKAQRSLIKVWSRRESLSECTSDFWSIPHGLSASESPVSFGNSADLGTRFPDSMNQAHLQLGPQIYIIIRLPWDLLMHNKIGEPLVVQ